MPLRDDQRNRVLDATDIVQLIGEDVALKPKGREFVGICPFHDDSNPSMTVSPAKQIYKCFSCGAGGTAFDFVMNYHKMTFPEALRHLAERAGIRLEPPRRDPDHGHGNGHDNGEAAEADPTDRQRLLRANATAAEFFRALYRHAEHGRIARDYVARREISTEMVEAFQIGYAPDRWDGLVMMVGERGWDARAFEAAGLISPRQQGNGFYDRLRHRLIFPICDALGRPIAFGGRKLRDEDEPKYLNSPETPLFNKSATLYGLHLAKRRIIETRTAVIVEGYTDVVACHQADVRNVVATLGTALTRQHASTLRHFADRVVLVFDGDEAGQNAADRAIEVFLAGEVDVAIAVVPGGLDPAELLGQPGGLERWQAAIDQASDALDFQLRRIGAQLQAETTITGRQRQIEEYLRRLAQAGFAQMTGLRRNLVLRRLSQLLGLPQDEIASMLRRFTPRRRAPGEGVSESETGDSEKPEAENVAAVQSSHRLKAIEQVERLLIGCLLSDPTLFDETLSEGRSLEEELPPTQMVTASGRDLYDCIYTMWCDGQEISLPRVLTHLTATGQSSLSSWATQAEMATEQATDADPERRRSLVVEAAQKLIEERARQQLETENANTRNDRAQDPTDQAEALRRQLAQQSAQRRTPAKIIRLGS